MPIEFCFVPKDEPQKEYEHELVEPGSVLIIENYISGQVEKIAVACSDNNEVAVALLFDAQDSEDLIVSERMDLGDLPMPLEAIPLEKDGEHKDIPFSDGEGGDGFLRLRFVGSQAITASCLVPRGLINQN